MVLPFLIGLLLGFVLSIPPGPIGVSAMRQGLSGDRYRGWWLGAGAAIMDLLYVVVALQFTSALTQTFQHYLSHHSLGFLLFQLLAGVLLIGYGIVNLKVRRIPLSVERKPPTMGWIDRLSQRKSSPFVIGIALALANLANPTFLPSLLYMVVFVQDLDIVSTQLLTHLAFGLGFSVGVFLWIALLTELFCRLRHRLSATVLEFLHRFAGLTLIGIGTYLGYRVVTVIRWADVLRFAF